METVILEKATKIAVYTWEKNHGMMPLPSFNLCRNSFTPIYDEEVLSDQLVLYDYFTLHLEDFTGQYGVL
jgi:hypothetical protein